LGRELTAREKSFDSWLLPRIGQAIRLGRFSRRDEREQAEQEVERAHRCFGDDPIVDSCEAMLWAQRGEAARADAALVRAEQERPSLGHIHHTWHQVAAAIPHHLPAPVYNRFTESFGTQDLKDAKVLLVKLG
jgi:hypothetical protein